MDKVMWEVYVPTLRKNGKPIHTRFHKVWDQKVMAITGGLSIHHPSIGYWVNPFRRIYRERMIPVRIVATREEIEKVLEITSAHYEDEEEILCYRISDEIIFRGRK